MWIDYLELVLLGEIDIEFQVARIVVVENMEAGNHCHLHQQILRLELIEYLKVYNNNLDKKVVKESRAWKFINLGQKHGFNLVRTPSKIILG